MIKFRNVSDRYEASELGQIDAAALLGVSERTFRRGCVRFEDAGESGLLDRRLGHASGKRVPSIGASWNFCGHWAGSVTTSGSSSLPIRLRLIAASASAVKAEAARPVSPAAPAIARRCRRPSLMSCVAAPA